MKYFSYELIGPSYSASKLVLYLIYIFQSETEWQAFQRHCLEIVAKLAELLPGETFSLLVMTDCMLTVYWSVIKVLTPGSFHTFIYTKKKKLLMLWLTLDMLQGSTFRKKSRGQLATKFSDLVASTSILVAKNFRRPFGPYIFSSAIKTEHNYSSTRAQLN